MFPTLITSSVLMREERRPRGSGSANLANHELGKVRLSRWRYRSRLGIFRPMNELVDRNRG